MVDLVKPGSLTLETGGGVSTVCFAANGSEHICIEPDAQLQQRIREYCRVNHISTEKIRFIAQGSERTLPLLDFGGRRIDFALINGSHAFPMPLVDFFYVNASLKIGGYVAVDDLYIRTVNILHKFLMTDPAYERWHSTKTKQAYIAKSPKRSIQRIGSARTSTVPTRTYRICPCQGGSYES
ncbi:MAG: class I SAM-dependent methyltransferase [Euryarchaeota archaeon]|nr:class I SAM-dependent methyltransferase [Euryarchaeota archaeon]